jgi:hypothetical protein
MNDAPRDLRTRLTRRRLLQGVGTLAAFLTSPIWRPSTAFGQDAGTPPKKRFIGLFSANGTIPSAFFPAGTAAEAPLALGPILSPLEKHRAKLLVLKGVHMTSANVPQPGGPHMKGPGAMLTGGKLLEGSFPGAGGPAGYADRISVDQFVANRIGTGTTFRSLEFGVRTVGGGPLEIISYRDSNQPNKAVDDPWQMYSRIFANGNLSSTQLARLIAERKSVLDFLKDDMARLRPRVSASDRARLDAHLTGIAGIEQQLAQSKASCTPPTLPAKVDPRDIAKFAQMSQMQMDLMLLSHICGLTQVSTLMWANADSWQYFPFAGVDEEHHALSHSGDSDTAAADKLVKINTWHAGQVAYILDKLAATTEVGGGSMLDNTVVLWGNELGVGNSHTYQDIPWVIAGGGGYFKTGRYLQYKDRNHNDLLVSICHALGLTDTNTFGIPELCTGALAGLTG